MRAIARRSKLRVAILSIAELAGTSPAGNSAGKITEIQHYDAPLCAHLAIGNVTVAQHQLAFMLGLGAQRVICISQKCDSEIIKLQHLAEDAGAKFHLVAGPRGLLGLITATDEVLCLADGLVAWPQIAAPLLDRAGVTVQPIDKGLAAGFERLDAQYASAGAIQLPGRLVERLSELPADSDTFSALQRIALQAGVPQRPLPENALENGLWNLVHHDDDAHRIEVQWIDIHSKYSKSGNVTSRLSQSIVRAFGPALLHAGSSNTLIAYAGLVLVFLALVLGWFGWIATAFAITALTTVVFQTAHLLGRVERAMQQLPPHWVWRTHIYDWLVDLMLLLIMLWGRTASANMMLSSDNLLTSLFPPLVLLGLLRLFPQFMARNLSAITSENTMNWRVWFADRFVVSLVLLALCFGGVLTAGIMLGGLLMLLLGIFTLDDPEFPSA